MIPTFDNLGLLPPFTDADPAASDGRSPYQAAMSELATRFSGTPSRMVYLRGLLAYRKALSQIGLQDGFQYIAGSFTEDCEKIRGREPGDIDVVTYLRRPGTLKSDPAWTTFLHSNTWLLRRAELKAKYHLDALYVELDQQSESLVDICNYWFGLFTHQRDTLRWKGIIRVELVSDDTAAEALLGGPAP